MALKVLWRWPPPLPTTTTVMWPPPTTTTTQNDLAAVAAGAWPSVRHFYWSSSAIWINQSEGPINKTKQNTYFFLFSQFMTHREQTTNKRVLSTFGCYQSLFCFNPFVQGCSNLYFLGHCNFQSCRLNRDGGTVRDCGARCQQSQMSQVSLSHSWHFQRGGLMENYLISFPKHFHYCNKATVCFADIPARESMQRASEVPVQKKSNPRAYAQTCTHINI